MLFFLERGFKLALPTILFKFLRDSIRETRTGITSKKGKFITNGRLISYILVENGMVDNLLVSGLTFELVKDDGKFLWGETSKAWVLSPRSLSYITFLLGRYMWNKDSC